MNVIFFCQIMSIINEKVKQKTVANDLQDIMIVAQQIYPTIVSCRNYLSFSIQEKSLLLWVSDITYGVLMFLRCPRLTAK